MPRKSRGQTQARLNAVNARNSSCTRKSKTVQVRKNGSYLEDVEIQVMLNHDWMDLQEEDRININNTDPGWVSQLNKLLSVTPQVPSPANYEPIPVTVNETRTPGPQVTVTHKHKRVTTPAQRYGSKYDSELRFLRCGCCLQEESSSKFVELTKARQLGFLRFLGQVKVAVLTHLRRSDSSSFERSYANAYETYVDEEGIFDNSKYLCVRCFKDLKKESSKSVCPVVSPESTSTCYAQDRCEDSDSDVDDEVFDDHDDSHEDDGDDEDGAAYARLGLESNEMKNKSTKGLIHALVHGLVPGKQPSELSGLTTVELSLIALINPLSKMRLSGKSHYEACKPTYTIVNNVNSVAAQLPRTLSDTDFAILRSHNGQVSKDFTFRPSVVMNALLWLKSNNHLYKDVHIEAPSEWIASDGELKDCEIPIPTIDLSMEETTLVDEGKDIIDQIDHSGHESSGTATDLLLLSSFDKSSNMDLLQGALDDAVDDLGLEGDIGSSGCPKTVSAQINIPDLLALVIERGGQAEFTDANKENYFIEMCFPQYFPYGRGGPGDPLSKHDGLSKTAKVIKFARLALTSGGHYRRLQNDFRFISLCYYVLMRKRMAGKCRPGFRV